MLLIPIKCNMLSGKLLVRLWFSYSSVSAFSELHFPFLCTGFRYMTDNDQHNASFGRKSKFGVYDTYITH